MIEEQASDDVMKYDKRGTNWLPLTTTPGSGTEFEPPRFASEQAIVLLSDNLKQRLGVDHLRDAGIVGAEWWYQVRSMGTSIDFHYDKDEAKASNEMKISYPLVSTVTYLGDFGAPTLIYNQTSLDGNMNTPVLPTSGALVFPEPGKHMQFPGHLMHGVAGSLARQERDNLPRVTFLINWWTSVPGPPNCRPMDPARIDLYHPVTQDALVPDSQADGHLPHLSPVASESRFVLTVLPPEERVHVLIPNSLANVGQVLLEWREEQVFGGATELDLHHGQLMSFIHGTKLPKVLLFYSGGKLSRVEMQFLRAIKPFLGQIVALLADAHRTSDAMNFLGVSPKVLPIVVIHDTANQLRYHCQGKFSTQSTTKCLNNYFKGKLTPLSQHTEL
eukprot:m.107736 g.107736  ORF g.107736 m.107736 type:complete len:388 (-) comp22595_c0_seq5:359-1522(-)